VERVEEQRVKGLTYIPPKRKGEGKEKIGEKEQGMQGAKKGKKTQSLSHCGVKASRGKKNLLGNLGGKHCWMKNLAGGREKQTTPRKLTQGHKRRDPTQEREKGHDTKKPHALTCVSGTTQKWGQKR